MTKELSELNDRVVSMPQSVEAYMERGIYYYGYSEFGFAINDFNKVLELDSDNDVAKQYLYMIREILTFRYTDIYNP